MPVLAEGMGPSAAAVVGLLDFLVIVAALVWSGPAASRNRPHVPCAEASGAQYRRAGAPAALIEARQERGHHA